MIRPFLNWFMGGSWSVARLGVPDEIQDWCPETKKCKLLSSAAELLRNIPFVLLFNERMMLTERIGR